MIAAAILYTALFALLVLAFWFGAKVVRAVRGPVEAVHTWDCLDWRARGNRDMTCTAEHGTDWFAPYAQAEHENHGTA